MKSEIELGRFGLDATSESDDVPWQLSSDNIKLANARVKQIVIPSYLDFKVQFLFSYPSRLKSHDWKQVFLNT